MRHVWYWLVRFGCWLVLDLRIYYLWSRLGRRLYEKDFVKKPIREYTNEDELQMTMERWVWRRDPFWQLFDMISCPAYVEFQADNQRPVGDCDDFSVYAAQALQQIAQKQGGIGGKVIAEISILTVPWMEKNGTISGHNVCVFRWLEQTKGWHWAWVSNWYDCKIQWNHPSGQTFEGPGEIAAHMCIQADATNLRWARVTPDLRRVVQTGTAI